jgi:hypothetical protein
MVVHLKQLGLNRLKKNVVFNEFYTLNVLQHTKQVYTITIPSTLNHIKKQLLKRYKIYVVFFSENIIHQYAHPSL